MIKIKDIEVGDILWKDDLFHPMICVEVTEDAVRFTEPSKAKPYGFTNNQTDIDYYEQNGFTHIKRGMPISYRNAFIECAINRLKAQTVFPNEPFKNIPFFDDIIMQHKHQAENRCASNSYAKKVCEL